MQSVNRIPMFICIQCIICFHCIDTWDEHFSKELDISSNSTKQIDSMQHTSACHKILDISSNSTKQIDSMHHTSACHKVSRLIIKPKMWFYECFCLPDLDLCLVDESCCEEFPTDCSQYLKEILKGFERLLGLQGDCLKLVNSLAISGCPHKANWVKEAEYEVETTWYNDHLLYTRSCRNRCSRTKPHLVKKLETLCSCDVRCPVYRNCCEDFQTECPLVYKESLKKFGHMMDLQADCLEMAYTFAIVGCPQQTNYTRKLINQDSFSDIFDNTPITDATTGLVFANMDIFSCNMPGRSHFARKWNIVAALTNKDHWPICELKKPLKLFAPRYRAPMYADEMSKCNADSISLCNNSIFLQRQCQSFLPFYLLKNIVKNYDVCRDCSLSTRLSFDSFHDESIANVTILTDKLLYHGHVYHGDYIPWNEAKCDMSPNATLSRAQCYFVRCSLEEAYYLRNGTCRAFYLFSIAFQLELIQLNDNQKENIFNYIAFYLFHVLNIKTVGTVRPLMSFYNKEIQQNMTLATFMFDFNSSALEDFFYYTYRDGLYILTAQLRAYVNQQTRTNLSETNLNLSLMNENEVVWEEFSNNLDWIAQKTALMNFYWCKWSMNYFPFKFFLFRSSFETYGLCFCRFYHKIYSENCFESKTCDFICFDETNRNLIAMSVAENVGIYWSSFLIIKTVLFISLIYG